MSVVFAVLVLSIMVFLLLILYVVFFMDCFRCRICLEWATLLEDISSLHMNVGDW